MSKAVTIQEVSSEFRHFAEIAAPFCDISSPERYEQTLELIESLMEDVGSEFLSR